MPTGLTEEENVVLELVLRVSSADHRVSDASWCRVHIQKSQDEDEGIHQISLSLKHSKEGVMPLNVLIAGRPICVVLTVPSYARYGLGKYLSFLSVCSESYLSRDEFLEAVAKVMREWRSGHYRLLTKTFLGIPVEWHLFLNGQPVWNALQFRILRTLPLRSQWTK